MAHWAKATLASGHGSILINMARVMSVRRDEQRGETVVWFGSDETQIVRETPEELIEQAATTRRAGGVREEVHGAGR